MLFAYIPNLYSDKSTHTHTHAYSICSSMPKGQSCLKASCYLLTTAVLDSSLRRRQQETLEDLLTTAILDSSLQRRQQETLEGSRETCRSPGAGPPAHCFGASYLCYCGTAVCQSLGVWAVRLLTQAPDLICLRHHLHGLGWKKHQERRGVTSAETQKRSLWPQIPIGARRTQVAAVKATGKPRALLNSVQQAFLSLING